MSAPSYQLGQRLAGAVNSLEDQQDKVLFWCIRFDDRIRNRLAVQAGLLGALQQLRINLGALLPPHRLALLDEVLAENAILQNLDPFDLRAGYFSQRTYLIRKRSADEAIDEDLSFHIRIFNPEMSNTEEPDINED